MEEDGYDPTEDIAWAESQSHLILAVARVSDPEQTPVLKAIEAAKKRHPEWPIIVAQTGLHDLYPAGAPHPEPNFSDPGKLMDGTFGAVREALAHQRQLFGDLRGSAPIFVPIDFTRMEDGYAPPDYGSDELRVALVNQGLVIIEALKKTGDDAFANRNWTTILAYATLAAGGAVVPVPFVDMAAFTVTNALMFQALARRYGVTWDKEMFGKFCVAIGAGVLAARALRFAAVELIKLVPIVGSAAAAAINGATAFGTTVGLGQAACVWLDHERRGETAPDDAVRAAFAEGLAQRPPGPDPKEQK